MSNNIKQLKPRKNGRYNQGYINQLSCKKLFPQLKVENIIYRSSYEKKFIYLQVPHGRKKDAGECL